MICIVNAEPEGYAAEAGRRLNALGTVINGPFDRAGLVRAVAGADILIVRLGHRVDAALIDSAPRLAAIVSATTGLDHIDEAYAARKGIEVLSLRGETAFLESVDATAEHSWALLLGLMRNLPAAAAAARLGDWDRGRFRGRELKGKRLGVFGLGRIGRKVAGYGLAFGMRVRACDPSPDRWIEGVTRKPSPAALFADSDIVSVHLPLDDSTRGIVSVSLLEALPSGAVLINTARGELIDESALIAALDSGRLSGAALDVIVGEVDRNFADSAILRYAAGHGNVILTPHIGGATYESMEATELFMTKKLASFLSRQAVEKTG